MDRRAYIKGFEQKINAVYPVCTLHISHSIGNVIEPNVIAGFSFFAFVGKAAAKKASCAMRCPRSLPFLYEKTGLHHK